MGAIGRIGTLKVPDSETENEGPAVSPRKLHNCAVRAFIPVGKWIVQVAALPACSHSRNNIPSP